MSGNVLSLPGSLLGPGGEAVATSELDPFPLSDLSAAFTLLAPLSICPSFVHPGL